MPLDAIGPVPFHAIMPAPAPPPLPTIPFPPLQAPPGEGDEPPAPPPTKQRAGKPDLSALFPLPVPVALDAADAARALLAGVDAEGVRLRRADKLACEGVVAAGGAATWREAGRMFRLSRHHLADPA